MVNKVMLIGNLGKDVEVRFTPNGKALAKFPLATEEKWTDTDGNKQSRTEWHNVTVWGKMAEICGQYLAKGRQVFVEGSIRTRTYEKDGVKHYMTEIVARDVRFLGGGSGGGRSTQATNQQASQGGGGAGPGSGDDGYVAPEDEDIPF